VYSACILELLASIAVPFDCRTREGGGRGVNREGGGREWDPCVCLCVSLSLSPQWFLCGCLFLSLSLSSLSPLSRSLSATHYKRTFMIIKS
jgi:hypothetical protein